MKNISLFTCVIAMSFCAMADGLRKIAIEPIILQKLGLPVTDEKFAYRDAAKKSLRVQKGKYLKSSAECYLSYKNYGPRPISESLDMMRITSGENEYDVNEVRYFENGIVYIAWQSPSHGYQIAYPRIMIRIFDRNGKTVGLALQDGFVADENSFCKATPQTGSGASP